MAFEYNVPVIDFTQEREDNDGADAFFDMHLQFEEKLTLKSDVVEEEKIRTSGNHVKEEQLETSRNDMKEENLETSRIDVREEKLETSTNDMEEEQQRPNPDENEPPAINWDPQECITSDSYNLNFDSKSCASEDLPERDNILSVEREEKWGNTVLKEITGSVQSFGNIQGKKRKSDIDHRNVKFISLAEGVKEFQLHIRSKGKKGLKMTSLTVPQSPLLLCKKRSRPVDYPSAEEREKKEVEEIRSHTFKAHPVNRKVFEYPKLGRKVSREPVVVEPVLLTEFKRKEPKKSDSPFLFKAKPLPKAILQHPVGVPEKKKLPSTLPHTPRFTFKPKPRLQIIEEVDGCIVSSDRSPPHTNVPSFTHGKTVVQPFSFEERDKVMMEKKEEKIKKILQEEKEARKFHANPVPGFIKKYSRSADNSQSPSTSGQISEIDEERKIQFKAQPALVLQKKPFLPKLPEKSFTHPANLVLHTQERAQSRKEFDEHLKQRAENIEAFLRQRKELEEQSIQEEIAVLRQKMVHKAQPIRTYKPIPERPKPVVTSPDTPKFTSRSKK